MIIEFVDMPLVSHFLIRMRMQIYCFYMIWRKDCVYKYNKLVLFSNFEKNGINKDY